MALVGCQDPPSVVVERADAADAGDTAVIDTSRGDGSTHACPAVRVGEGGVVEVGTAIGTLEIDPPRNLLYALGRQAPTVWVLDTCAKAIVTSYALPAPGSDLAVSPNGAHLAVGHAATRQVSRIDLASGSVQSVATVQGWS